MSYSSEFFSARHQTTVDAARRILAIVLDAIPEIESAVDVGCGVGTWLSVLRRRGVDDIQGIDGTWVDRGHLEIPSEAFRAVDLNSPVHLPRRFDLAISLEVAEHLPEQSAAEFVESLTDLSDFVLFSAAIPLQGGNNHLNEQWPDYWVERFAARNYLAFDFIRPAVWNDDQIPYWYRQNTLFFATQTREPEVAHQPTRPLRLVHPQLFLAKAGRPGQSPIERAI